MGDVSVSADPKRGEIYLATPDGGTNLTPAEAVGLIGRLAEELRELWPSLDPAWERDPSREDLTGRIGQEKARRRG